MATKVSPTGNFVGIQKEAQAKITQQLARCVSMFGTTWNIRDRMKDIDRAYLRNTDSTKETRAAEAAQKQDPTKFTNVIVPIVKPQVESSVAHLAEVFLSGWPIFGVSATVDFQDAAMQMETILKDQEDMGGWPKELQSCFRDGKKYNLMAAEVSWKRVQLPSVKNDLSSPNAAKVEPETFWEGNSIKRIDLYNAFWDLRCEPNKVHSSGEFAGYNELKSHIELVRFMWELGNTQLNRKAALESKMGFTGVSAPTTANYHIPEINSKAVVDNRNAAFNWQSWFGNIPSTESGIKLADSYVVTTFYLRLMPKTYDLNVPAPNTPAVWKFVIVNGQHIIFAEQLRSAHEYLPFVLSTMDCGDLGYQENGLATEMTPYQQLASAYANGGVHAMRKAVNDRVLYDPSKIDKKDIENSNPASKIPVKAGHYGKPLNEAVYAFPFRDTVTSIALNGVGQVQGFANQASGQNAAQQGQFVKGNKTLREYADVQANANGRNVNTAINVEHNFMKPIKDMLRMNILQFQTSTSVFNEKTQEMVDIDPVLLRRAVFKFKMSDGLTPADKIMNADSFATSFQMIATSPALQTEFDIGGLAIYMMKQQRADISPFQKSGAQKAYEQAVAQWQQIMTLIANGKAEGMQLPPQPKPADYGWDPNAKNTAVPTSDPTGKPAIISQVAQQVAAQQNNGNGNAQPNQPPPTTGA